MSSHYHSYIAAADVTLTLRPATPVEGDPAILTCSSTNATSFTIMKGLKDDVTADATLETSGVPKTAKFFWHSYNEALNGGEYTCIAALTGSASKQATQEVKGR